MKASSSAQTLDETYENEGTNERTAAGHWKCLDEEVDFTDRGTKYMKGALSTLACGPGLGGDQ